MRLPNSENFSCRFLVVFHESVHQDLVDYNAIMAAGSISLVPDLDWRELSSKYFPYSIIFELAVPNGTAEISIKSNILPTEILPVDGYR